MKINDDKIVKRWDSVMNSIGCEYLTVNDELSELEERKDYYDTEDGISVGWMIEEAKYWLSCYHESGNVRCDDRFLDSENYKIWVSETGMLKRLIARLEKLDYSMMVVEW